MGFREMIARLIQEGLIDNDHNLTQKGHDYVEEVKRNYRKRMKPAKGETDDRTYEREPEDVC